MSQPSETLDINVQASPPDVEDVDDEVTLEDLIEAFLDVNPTPEDTQIHSLASLLGYTPESFEEYIYEMFSEYVNEDESVEEPTVDEPDDEEYDPVDTFLVLFFAYRPDPSDAEVHQLATLLGFTPEQLEERLFAMLAESEEDRLASTDI